MPPLLFRKPREEVGFSDLSYSSHPALAGKRGDDAREEERRRRQNSENPGRRTGFLISKTLRRVFCRGFGNPAQHAAAQPKIGKIPIGQ